MTFEEQVRERAYHIWLAGGMADGHAEEHWVCAEQALRDKTATSDEPVVILTKTAAKPRKDAAAKSAAKTGRDKAGADKAGADKAKVARTTAKVAAKPAAKAAKADGVQPTAH